MRALVIDASVWVSAADQNDSFSTPSRAFLTAVARETRPVAIHAFAAVEISCALGRRLRDAERAKALTVQLLRSPLITSHALDPSLLEKAVEVGTRDLLRAGDSLYSALSQRVEGEIVSWDDDLLERAGAITPLEWIGRRDASGDPVLESDEPNQGPEPG